MRGLLVADQRSVHPLRPELQPGLRAATGQPRRAELVGVARRQSTRRDRAPTRRQRPRKHAECCHVDELAVLLASPVNLRFECLQRPERSGPRRTGFSRVLDPRARMTVRAGRDDVVVLPVVGAR